MIWILFLLGSQSGFAASSKDFIVKEKLSWNDKVKESSSPKESGLRHLRELYLSKKWPDCVESAEKNLLAWPQIQPWILQVELACAQGLRSKTSRESLVRALNSFERYKVFCFESPAWKTLRASVQRSQEALIELLLKEEIQSAPKWIERYNSLFDDRESRAKAMLWSSVIAQNQRQMPEAENFLEQSLSLFETKTARDRLNSLRLALNSKKTEAQNLKLDILPEAEQRFEERFKNSLHNNDLIAFAEDSVVYLNQFPNGRRAKWAQDKLFDLYFGFSEKSDEKFSSLRLKTLNLMERLEPNRLVDFARTLHRRADFTGALQLSEKALMSLGSSTDAGVLLYVAGRSAQMTGDYRKARRYFEMYVEGHSALEDIFEVQFRLGLTHLRMASYSSAVAVFEKLLTTKGSDKYDLLSRYWLVRSLQKMENLRALDEIKALIAKYPFSYYGLRLQAEINDGKIENIPALSNLEDLKAEQVWTSFQKAAWDRALLLGRNSWIAESLAELSNVSQSLNAGSKVLLAKKASENKMYPMAIRWVGEALDADPNLQSMDLVNLGLPAAYFDQIKIQAEKQKLNPILVQSLIRQESAFNERATSTSKAMGLMQLIPPTAAEVAQDLRLNGLDLPDDSYLPGVNLQMGTFYIAKMIKQFDGVIPLGLAAYNAGPTRMEIFRKARPDLWTDAPGQASWDQEIWFDELPWSETSFYVKAILRNTILYRLQAGQKVQLNTNLWSDLVPVP